jgi:hypothetical protein
MCIDVFVHTPFFLLPCFYGWTGAVKGQDTSTTIEQFQKEWLEASTGSVLFWAPTMYAGFKYIPQHSRSTLLGKGKGKGRGEDEGEIEGKGMGEGEGEGGTLEMCSCLVFTPAAIAISYRIMYITTCSFFHKVCLH